MMQTHVLRRVAGVTLFLAVGVGAFDHDMPWKADVVRAQGSPGSPAPGRTMDHITGVSHIGLAVGDIEKSVADLSRVLAIPRPAIEDNVARQSKVAFVDLGGGVELEIVQNYSDAGAKAARERGDYISHFCLTTKDILADMAILKQRGVAFRDDPPRVGLTKKWISYTEPGTIGGLSFELLQPYPTPPAR